MRCAVRITGGIQHVSFIAPKRSAYIQEVLYQFAPYISYVVFRKRSHYIILYYVVRDSRVIWRPSTPIWMLRVFDLQMTCSDSNKRYTTKDTSLCNSRRITCQLSDARTVSEWALCMMTSSKGNISRVTGPLCGEFTVHRWIPLTKTSDTETGTQSKFPHFREHGSGHASKFRSECL